MLTPSVNNPQPHLLGILGILGLLSRRNTNKPSPASTGSSHQLLSRRYVSPRCNQLYPYLCLIIIMTPAEYQYRYCIQVLVYHILGEKGFVGHASGPMQRSPTKKSFSRLHRRQKIPKFSRLLSCASQPRLPKTTTILFTRIRIHQNVDSISFQLSIHLLHPVSP